MRKNTSNNSIGTPMGTGSGTKAVDLVTGKTKIEYYFDPSLVLSENSDGSSSSTGINNATSPSSLRASKVMEQVHSNSSYQAIYSSRHLYYPCSIVKPLEIENFPNATLVKTSDIGTLYKIRDSSLLQPVSQPDKLGVPNILLLPNATEPSLLHTLRTRYKRDEIYTNAGPILMSINPYKQIPYLYSMEKMREYRWWASNVEKKDKMGNSVQENTSVVTTAAAFNPKKDLPPHLFAVANLAYQNLFRKDAESIPMNDVDELGNDASFPKCKNQSIIISGESGAGKTEATKYIMQFLARNNNVHDSSSDSADLHSNVDSSAFGTTHTLEERVLSANPLLESFGNAQTLRNDNSSRFGKFIRIQFDLGTGKIAGASISNYLLEKTRITSQSDGERNYHIFYQLLGCEEELLERYGLSNGIEGWKYISSPGLNKKTRREKDVTALLQTRKCLENLNLTKDQEDAIFSIVAAVLHIGNIEFLDDDGGDNAVSIKEETLPSFQKVCELLGLEEDDVRKGIFEKQITIGGKVITKKLNKVQVLDKRDTLAKIAYSSLFVWLVHRVNETISADIKNDIMDEEDIFESQKAKNKKQELGFIGVLDIYGFEHFDVNGFEQMLINYANENLQRHFNRHLFELEQELYASEGVDWSYITFNDNKPCLDLIEGNIGILNTLDDAWSGMGSSSEKDVKFVSQLHASFGGREHHECFLTPKFGADRQFCIIHYAGEVKYTANDFVEKNVETLSNELKSLLPASNIPAIQLIFADTTSTNANTAANPGRRGNIRGVSVASQFKTSLQKLMSDLEKTTPHYIRCIKPNLIKQSNSLDSGEVLRQLRYAGMMEAIRIRRQGYANREYHESFYNRFGILLTGEERANNLGIQYLVTTLSNRLTLNESDWQIGHSKIFLRYELAMKLEALEMLKVRMAGRLLTKFGRIVARARAGKLLTSWGKMRLHFVRKYYRKRACAKIMATYRMYKQLLTYSVMKSAAVRIQTLIRQKLAVKKVNKLRDPYGEYSFKDMEKMVNGKKKLLEKAVEQKKFGFAAELEATIALLTDVMESKRPLTRDVLEERIAAHEKKIKELLERKAYAECDELQLELDTLIAKRAEIPTVEELKEAVSKAEQNIADAAERRDFKGAADGQLILDEAKKKLKEYLDLQQELSEENVEQNSEDNNEEQEGIGSRAELETQIKNISTELANVLAEKKFSEASEIQARLDSLEKLRKKFPSRTEMEKELQSLKQKMEEAMSKRKFIEAGQLDEKISTLEKKIEEEKQQENKNGISLAPDEKEKIISVTINNEMKTFSSRAELENEINQQTYKVEQYAKEKKFQDASESQKSLDKLISLRSKLPTIEEVNKDLMVKKAEMNAAIAKKDFTAAEKLDKEVEILQKIYDIEKEAQQKTAPSEKSNKMKTTVTSITSTPLSKKSTKTNTPLNIKSQIKPPTNKIKSNTTVVKTVNSTKTRPVSKLRPNKPIICSINQNVEEICKRLASKRADAGLITGLNGGLAGIITDTDITRRVVAKYLDPVETNISKVMTSNPTCVSSSDSAMDALGTMVENHFRHLPVVDESGAIVGVLDIAKCLNNAISKLEKASEKSSNGAEDAVKQMASIQGAGGAQAAALQALLGPLLSQAFGNNQSPTLRSLLAGRPATIVSPGTNLRETGLIMTEARKAALVVEDGELVGIFGFKDMMSRAIAKELPLELTAVSSVMTPNPEAISPNMTIVEALQMMHDNKFLTLPVCEDNGTVIGLVDVMDLIHGCGGADGWRSIFGSAMDVSDDFSDRLSVSSYDRSTKNAEEPVIRVNVGSISNQGRSYVPMQVTVPENDGVSSVAMSLNVDNLVLFKVVDLAGNNYRLRCECKYDNLLSSLAEKMGNVDVESIVLKFTDEEGDMILIKDDDCLQEAVSSSRSFGTQAIKLTVSVMKKKGISLDGGNDFVMIMAGAGAIAMLGIIFMLVSKPKK